MKNILVFLLIGIVLPSILVACSEQLPTTKNDEMQMPSVTQSGRMIYPETKKIEVKDTHFDVQLVDPYRWLEDDNSDATKNWVVTQNKVTFDYLDNIPYRDALKQRLELLWNFEKEGAPFKEGRYTYFYKNNGLQNQYVVYRQKEGGDAEIFLDPNTFSADGTTSLAQLSFSKDGSIAAYTISEGGSDWRKIIIIDVETKKAIEMPLVDVKFSGISWKANEGFYYSSYDKPSGSELSAKTDQHKLYYHKLGQSQADDEVVFGASANQKRRYVSGSVTEDDKYLIISGANSTSGNDLYIQDLSKSPQSLITILDDQDSDTVVLENVDNRLFLLTNRNSPNNKVVTVDVLKPAQANWIDLIPETNNVLEVTVGGGYFFAEYMVDASSKIYQYSYSGEKIREIPLEGVGSAAGLTGKKDDKVLYYTFTNYKTPSTIYAFSVDTGASQVYRNSGAKFISDDYESKQIFYSSKDGTKIPMIITYKKGIQLNGKNPTILYGYGGFNISLTPSFSVANAVWLEQGGIYAVPNLRGGGEYGKKWHDAGIQLNKQNVFDDFIAAAEYLIEEKYTSSEYLAISGRSNGGLLVGAVMTQRPELMRVALPGVGVLDMLRYHTFTAGAGWVYDYGTAEQSKEMFEYLKAYSPVHNVKKGRHYPATLIATGDHDDRVVPAHSFKFAAQLQDKQTGDLPTLIRIETNAGHGAGTPVSKIIEQHADTFGFILFNMGFDALPVKKTNNK